MHTEPKTSKMCTGYGGFARHAARSWITTRAQLGYSLARCAIRLNWTSERERGENTRYRSHGNSLIIEKLKYKEAEGRYGKRGLSLALSLSPSLPLSLPQRRATEKIRAMPSLGNLRKEADYRGNRERESERESLDVRT